MSDARMTIEQSIMRNMQSQETPVVIEDAVNQAKYITAILNSCLGRWFLLQKKTIPIPQISAADQQRFICLVDEILEAKAADPGANIEPLEWEIDGMVFDAVGLTSGERKEVYEGVAELVGNQKQKADSAPEAPQAVGRRRSQSGSFAHNVVARGEAIYEDKVRPHVDEEADRGKYVVIDIFSGDYEIDSTNSGGTWRLVDRRPGAITYKLRIGYPGVYNMNRPRKRVR